jgi:hypothetical protein
VKQGLLILLSTCAVVGLHARDTAPTDAWSPNVTTLTSPAGLNSAQPQLSVRGDRVLLSWIERSGEKAALRFAERTDAGWTDARSVRFTSRSASTFLCRVSARFASQ